LEPLRTVWDQNWIDPLFLDFYFLFKGRLKTGKNQEQRKNQIRGINYLGIREKTDWISLVGKLCGTGRVVYQNQDLRAIPGEITQFIFLLWIKGNLTLKIKG